MDRRFSRLTAFSCVLVLLCVLFSGCQTATGSETVYQRFTRRTSDIFDTEIMLSGFTSDEENFQRISDEVFRLLAYYNQVFDGYNAYDEMHNLYYINLHAAEGPVTVPEELFFLLSWCREKWDGGLKCVNPAMGAVLSIWHDYRTAGINDPVSPSAYADQYDKAYDTFRNELSYDIWKSRMDSLVYSDFSMHETRSCKVNRLRLFIDIIRLKYLNLESIIRRTLFEDIKVLISMWKLKNEE